MKAAIFDPAQLPYPEDRCAESACNHPRDLHFWSGRKNGERILNCVVPMTRMKGIFLPGLVLPDRAMESEIYREGREIAFEAP